MKIFGSLHLELERTREQTRFQHLWQVKKLMKHFLLLDMKLAKWLGVVL